MWLAGLDKTAIAFDKTATAAYGLDGAAPREKKWLGLAAYKLLVRDNMKSAIRNPNLNDPAIWPLPVDKMAIQPWPVLQFLDKTAIGLAWS